MPAYLDLAFQYNKKKLTGQTVRAFCDALLDSGCSFTEGYWGSEGDSYDEIISWNQQKLEQNFELGRTEHYSHDYKQMCFQYAAFSETRLFIGNQQEDTHFSFDLIFPQNDLFDEDAPKPWVLRADQLEKVETLAIHLWETGTMDCIQACWELSDGPVSYRDIAAGSPPQIAPFCIIPKSVLRSGWRVKPQPVGRDGAFIRDIGWLLRRE